MPDEMFFSDDRKSMRRGKRVSQRTETCRPCIVWLKDAPQEQYLGVVLDVNPYGMRIRMIDQIPSGSQIVVQMMRDDEFKVPLARPLDATVVRREENETGMVDHGIRIIQKQVRRFVSNRMPPPPTKPIAPRSQGRSYTLDVTVGDKTEDILKSKRNSGKLPEEEL